MSLIVDLLKKIRPSKEKGTKGVYPGLLKEKKSKNFLRLNLNLKLNKTKVLTYGSLGVIVLAVFLLTYTLVSEREKPVQYRTVLKDIKPSQKPESPKPPPQPKTQQLKPPSKKEAPKTPQPKAVRTVKEEKLKPSVQKPVQKELEKKEIKEPIVQERQAEEEKKPEPIEKEEKETQKTQEKQQEREEKKERKLIPMDEVTYFTSLYMAQRAFKRGDLPRSAQLYESILQSRRDLKVANNLIVVYIRMGKVEEAYKLVKEFANERLAYTFIVELARSGFVEKAISFGKSLKKLDNSGYVYLALGYANEIRGNLYKAFELYREGYKMRPGNVYLAYNYARLLEVFGDRHEAVEIYKKLAVQEENKMLKEVANERLRLLLEVR